MESEAGTRFVKCPKFYAGCSHLPRLPGGRLLQPQQKDLIMTKVNVILLNKLVLKILLATEYGAALRLFS
jgi:hypothetical protein